MQIAKIEFPKLTPFFRDLRTKLEENCSNNTNPPTTIVPETTLRLLHHPFAEVNGMSEINVIAPGLVRATVTSSNISNKHQNSYGSVHGGWTAAMNDTAMAAAVQTLAPNGRAVSVELAAKYYKPIQPGEKLLIRAEVLEDPQLPESIKTVASITTNKDGDTVFVSAGKFAFIEQPTSKQTAA